MSQERYPAPALGLIHHSTRGRGIACVGIGSGILRLTMMPVYVRGSSGFDSLASQITKAYHEVFVSGFPLYGVRCIVMLRCCPLLHTALRCGGLHPHSPHSRSSRPAQRPRPLCLVLLCLRLFLFHLRHRLPLRLSLSHLEPHPNRSSGLADAEGGAQEGEEPDVVERRRSRAVRVGGGRETWGGRGGLIYQRCESLLPSLCLAPTRTSLSAKPTIVAFLIGGVSHARPAGVGLLGRVGEWSLILGVNVRRSGDTAQGAPHLR
eukprot:747992-Rhodomonas_salina.4